MTKSVTPGASDENLPLRWDQRRDQLAGLVMAALIAYAMVRNTLRASVRLFWYDELCTWIMTTLPNASSVWHALLRAADGMPPGFDLLESLIGRLIPNQHVAFRMPSILGAGIALWCLFVWLRRRYGAMTALAATIVPLFTVFDSFYAVEARPYALVVACLAVALVCYDGVPAAGWTAGFASSLVAAESFHYYAVVAMTPFVAAEALYVWKKRTVRWQVWGALISGVVPLLFFWPLLASFKAYYGQHFWAKPTIATAAGTYGWLFGMPLNSVATARTTVIALVISTGCVLLAADLLRQSIRASGADERFSDGAQISLFLLLPLIFFAVIKATNGGFTERYALAVIIGLTLAVGYGLSHLSHRTVSLVAGLLVFCLASQELSFWLTYRLVKELRTFQQKPAEEMISAAGHQDLPVMVAGGNDYLQLVYYSSPQWKKRFVSVVDPEAALKYGVPDNGDKELQVFRDLMPLNVMDYADFRRKYPEFLVYSIPFRIPWMNDPDWWVVRLKDDGYIITTLKTNGRHSVYLAQQNSKVN